MTVVHGVGVHTMPPATTWPAGWSLSVLITALMDHPVDSPDAVIRLLEETYPPLTDDQHQRVRDTMVGASRAMSYLAGFVNGYISTRLTPDDAPRSLAALRALWAMLTELRDRPPVAR